MTKWISGAAVATTMAVMLGACSSSGSATATRTSPSTAGTSSSAPGSAPGPAVMVAQNPKEGAILVDGRGRTLYLFEKDTGTSTACTGSCAQIWPGYAPGGTLAGGPAVTPAKLSTTRGQVPDQVTYNGHLLYHFSGDGGPGDVNGIAIPDWFPIGPDGNKVTKGSADTNG